MERYSDSTYLDYFFICYNGNYLANRKKKANRTRGLNNGLF